MADCTVASALVSDAFEDGGGDDEDDEDDDPAPPELQAASTRKSGARASAQRARRNVGVTGRSTAENLGQAGVP